MRARVCLLAALFCLGACDRLPFWKKPIADGSRVRIHYTLEVDGRKIDDSRGRGPLEFVHGSGKLVPGLAEQLAGLKAGDKKTLTVPPSKAYGERDPKALKTFPISSFRGAAGVRPGAVVATRFEGRQVRAVVTAVTRTSVTLDFNHPLAGKELRYSVEILEVE